MNSTFLKTPRHKAAFGLVAGGAALLLLCGCHKTLSTAEKPSAAESDEKATAAEPAKSAENKKEPAGEEPAEGLTLKPEEIEKMGIVTTSAQASIHVPEVSGFGIVIAHETIAQAVAELRTAIATERQSRSAFERSKRLTGTPGAMPADTQEAAERQAAVDRAALDLARQRLSATLGQSPPWKTQESSPELLALASGTAKLVRVTFPLGSLGETNPGRVRLAHIDSSQGGKSWESHSVWLAPADASVPGRSFFAILKDSGTSEGDHLLAWAPVGTPESGVLVPASAAVVSGGRFWCYIEEKPGTFVRTELDPGSPTADGYFVKQGISAGEKIVTASAGQLLAREMNPSTEAE